MEASELKIDTASAEEMAATIFGEGVKIISASYTGAEGQVGIYSGADETMTAG